MPWSSQVAVEQDMLTNMGQRIGALEGRLNQLEQSGAGARHDRDISALEGRIRALEAGNVLTMEHIKTCAEEAVQAAEERRRNRHEQRLFAIMILVGLIGSPFFLNWLFHAHPGL